MSHQIGNRQAKKRNLGSTHSRAKRFEIRRGLGRQGLLLGTVVASSPGEAALFWTRRTLGGITKIHGTGRKNAFVGRKVLGLGRVGDTGTFNVVKAG